MMAALLLQSAFGPKPNPQQGQDQIAEQSNPDESTNVENQDSEPDPAPGVEPAPQDSDPPSDRSTDAETDLSSQAGAPSDETSSPVPEAIPEPRDEFVTIGSLAPDSEVRYLATCNKRGGTLRRVELNFRRQGKYRYRDMVWEGGYLGELDCESSPVGCVVRVVGDGTPAQQAGIKIGDIITSVDGEAIVDDSDFLATLEKKNKARSGDRSWCQA